MYLTRHSKAKYFRVVFVAVRLGNEEPAVLWDDIFEAKSPSHAQDLAKCAIEFDDRVLPAGRRTWVVADRGEYPEVAEVEIMAVLPAEAQEMGNLYRHCRVPYCPGCGAAGGRRRPSEPRFFTCPTCRPDRESGHAVARRSPTKPPSVCCDEIGLEVLTRLMKTPPVESRGRAHRFGDEWLHFGGTGCESFCAKHPDGSLVAVYQGQQGPIQIELGEKLHSVVFVPALAVLLGCASLPRRNG